MNRILFCILIFAFSVNSNIFSQKAVEKKIQLQFTKRKAEFAKTRPEVFSFAADKSLSKSGKNALQFLYSYMSLNDIADYDEDFFKKQVKSALEAREFFSWGKKVPDDLFRHFILPPRVNNENLDTGRMVFFNELKNRIKNMTMTEAALEVNHWCHEKVTYRPADGRTSAPLATVRTAFGRCGEESTFTVAALRAVSIPARQCYTPRWAHTDDNHAWVEVWCDGKWYYMGACEPAPALNEAWFTFPAQRAMMVHTNVFGKYYGNESKTEFPLYTKINVLENYTATKRFEVTVLDAENKPVKDASVRFQLYNYAEYYTIYSQNTNAAGKASVISGLGDLMILASKDGFYGYQKVSLAQENSLTLHLTRTQGKEYTEDLDITPPANKAVFVKDISEKTRVNNERLKNEDNMRNAYLATFMQTEDAYELAVETGLDKTEVAKYIAKSEGNFREISSFIRHNSTNKNTLALLSTLTDKDLRDTPESVLCSHLQNAPSSSGYDPKIFTEGVLSPRIGTELIRTWRPYLQTNFKKIFHGNVTSEVIKQWVVSNISLVNGENYSGCTISPAGVSKVRKADKISRDVFFVALCRSFDIPSKIEEATSVIQVYEGGKWTPVSLDPLKPVKPSGNLVLNYESKDDMTPQYSSYYSISKYDKGDFYQLNYEDDKRLSAFPAKLSLEEGYYRLTTGNRYPDGRVLAGNTYFNIEGGKTKELHLNIRELKVEKKIYGTVDNTIPKEWYAQKGMVIAFIEPDKEPTKHIMNDIPAFKKQFDEWGGNFVFAVPELNLTSGFHSAAYKNLPENSNFIIRNAETIMESFLQSVNMSFRENYPLLYIVNPKGEITFYSEGYRIGMGDVLWKAIKMEK